MAESKESLEETLAVYENQLEQVNEALKTAGEEQQADLNQLKNDLNEIIELTKTNLSCFQDNTVENSVEETLKDELETLEGMKCKVPFHQGWGPFDYHNAIILNAEFSEDNSITVRVVFMHPISKKMQPCPYFLQGSCRYTDEKCHYSHGHLVKLDEIKDYSEPDYSSMTEGSLVLAKQEDGLWCKGTVEEITDDANYLVKFSDQEKTVSLTLHSVYPLESTDEESESDDDFVFIPRSLLNDTCNSTDERNEAQLGQWEKYTTGIGSKLMEKMGYIPGLGLGKHGEGRLNPVEAIVFPPGRSLDHCMELREKHADNEDLFKVEKRLEREKAKEQRRLSQMAAHAEKNVSVFNFINSKLIKPTKPEPEASTSDTQQKMAELKTMSSKMLNVESFQINEKMKLAQREIDKLEQSLKRQIDRGDPVTCSKIRSQLETKQKELQGLLKSEMHITREQTRRKNATKLTIF